MLTPEEIEQMNQEAELRITRNEERYLSLINSIKRSDCDIERCVKWLQSSDFFRAPASTKYHANYEGGLCQHSLNVYDELVKLYEQLPTNLRTQIDPESLIIVALSHDFAKVNVYEKYIRNVNTNVKDAKGKDIWEKVEEYKMKDPDKRFLFGNHEQNSEFIAHTFFPLKIEESVAILNHHGGKGYDSAQTDLTPIYNKYTLALLLHLADMLATFVDEKI